MTDLFADATATSALFSDCGVYRYSLWRQWHPDLPRLAFCMLNPSTADEVKNDPTVERCQRRAIALGFGSLVVVNVFAVRSTDRSILRTHPDPVGPLNDLYISRAVAASDRIICAWGEWGSLHGRDREVLQMIRHAGKVPHALKLNADGSPAHPLYLPYTAQPQPIGGTLEPIT